jgi:prepilin-type N-terminal cleavage/methylation domain-containing protein
MTPPGRRTPPADDGFALIEVLVSALVLAIVATGVLSLLQATTHSAARERKHSEAYALAQEVQARLRSMRLTSLNGLKQTLPPMVLDGTAYTVKSTGVFINNKTSIASCTGGEKSISADYVQITSTVSWSENGKQRKAEVQSIVSPSSGSVDPNHGTLVVSAVNAMQKPLSGVLLKGEGEGKFEGTTDLNGCATFADLPSGTYWVVPTATGFVDRFGKPPSKVEAGVRAGETQPVELEYDRPGTLEVKFKYRVGSSAEFKPSSASSIMVYHPVSMKTPTVFSTTGKAFEPVVKVPGLFPSKEAYAAYAGSCTSNNPNPKSEKEAPGAAAVVGVLVPSNGNPNPIPEIQLPALNLVVKNGTTTTVTGAKVKITGTCSFTREYTTSTGGVLSDPGLPWGTYEVCASAKVPEGKTEGQRRLKAKSVTVQNLASGTSLTLDLASSSAEKGLAC